STSPGPPLPSGRHQHLAQGQQQDDVYPPRGPDEDLLWCNMDYYNDPRTSTRRRASTRRIVDNSNHLLYGTNLNRTTRRRESTARPSRSFGREPSRGRRRRSSSRRTRGLEHHTASKHRGRGSRLESMGHQDELAAPDDASVG
ncbi:unnamed protein product, partial [Amoebophrya sp. A25]